MAPPSSPARSPERTIPLSTTSPLCRRSRNRGTRQADHPRPRSAPARALPRRGGRRAHAQLLPERGRAARGHRRGVPHRYRRALRRGLPQPAARRLHLGRARGRGLPGGRPRRRLHARGRGREVPAREQPRARGGRPADMAVTTHVCRGNYHSAYASSGPYDLVAPVLFARENVDAFYLEFDDERSGGFEPLAHVAPGKKVVLGLVTTKRPELEDSDAVIDAHPRSRALRPARGPLPLSAVRLCQLRDRQQAHRGRAVDQDRARAQHRRGGLARAPPRPSKWGQAPI